MRSLVGQTLSLDGYPEFSDAGRHRLRYPHGPPEAVVGRTLATRAVLQEVGPGMRTSTDSYGPTAILARTTMIKRDIREELP